MSLDITNFSNACNPNTALVFSNEIERQYYIDFTKARSGNRSSVGFTDEFFRTITLSGDLSCQLFTGHRGCGKSTELRKLKYKLELEGFHVVYFDSSKDLTMDDVDIIDILITITNQIRESLATVNIKLDLIDFQKQLQKVLNIRKNNVSVLDESIISLINKDSYGNAIEASPTTPDIVESINNNLLEIINKELLVPANRAIQERGQKGIVVIVDILDHLENTEERNRAEDIFIICSEELRQFHCHIIYTTPLILNFSKSITILSNRFGGLPQVIPMISVKNRDGTSNGEGIDLIRQVILARAFPDIPIEKRILHLNQIFDAPTTCERLCIVSGGHIRNLLNLLRDCLQKQDTLPIASDTLEEVIATQRDSLVKIIKDNVWELLQQVKSQKIVVAGEKEYQTLLHSLFVFEYLDENGNWFGLNPILDDAKQLEEYDDAYRLTKEIKLFFRYAEAEIEYIKAINQNHFVNVKSASGILANYVPMPVVMVDQPSEKNIIELVSYAEEICGDVHDKVSILLYRERPDALALLEIAKVQIRDHFIVIPIPFAEMKRVLVDLEPSFASLGLLTQYISRYMPGANLFNDSSAIGDTLSFFGRKNLLISLKRDLQSCKGVGLFGLRKAGKTSLLLQLGLSMRQQHPVIHIDLQPYAGRLYYGAAIFKKILERLTNLIGNDPNISHIFYNFDSDSPAKNSAANFMEMISKLSLILSKSGYRKPIVCILDEVERILPSDSDLPNEARQRIEEFNTVFGTFRALSQESNLLSLIIADLHPDCNSINHWHLPSLPRNPVYKFFKEVFVTPFSQDETIQMLTDIGLLMGIEFEEQLKQIIHEKSGGHPYLSRQLTRFLWEDLVDTEKRNFGTLIKVSDATNYLERPLFISSDLGDYFEKNIWDDLQERSKLNFSPASASINILKLLSCNEEKTDGVDDECILERLSEVCTENDCGKALRWLESVGLIQRHKLIHTNAYCIKVPLMSKWLQRKMKLEEIKQWKLN